MGIVLTWNSNYPTSIDDTTTNFPVVTNNVHDVLASHVNELANAVTAMQTVMGGLRQAPIEEPLTLSNGDLLEWNTAGGEWRSVAGSAIQSLQLAYTGGATVSITASTPIALTTTGASEDGVTVTDGTDTIAIRGVGLVATNNLAISSEGQATLTIEGTLDTNTVDEVAVSITPLINKAVGGDYTAFLINPTVTASDGLDDRLLDLQVGGASQAYVTNAGSIRSKGGGVTDCAFGFASQIDTGLWLDAANLALNSDAAIRFYLGGAYRYQLNTVAFVPTATNVYDLGSTSIDWRNLHLSGQRVYDAVAATGDEVLFDFAGVVNKATSGAYTGIKVDVTETLVQGTDNRLLDLQTGGVPRAWITNAGSLRAGGTSGGTNGDPALGFGNTDTMGFYAPTVSQMNWAVTGVSRMVFSATIFGPVVNNSVDLGTSAIRWKDLHIAGQVVNTVSVATGDEALFDFAGTVNKATSGNYTALLVDTTETAAPGADNRLLDLQVGGVTKAHVTSLGYVYAGRFANISDITTGVWLGATVSLVVSNTTRLRATTTAVESWRDLVPQASATYDLGTSSLVWKDMNAGRVIGGGGSAASPSHTFAGDLTTGFYLSGGFRIAVSGVGRFQFSTSALIGLTDDTLDLGASTFRWRDLHIAGQIVNTTGIGAVDAAMFDFAGTTALTGSANYTGILLDVTDTASPGTDNRLLDLQVGGTTQAYIKDTGQVRAGGGNSPANPALGFSLAGADGMGFFPVATSQLGLAFGGVNRFDFTSAVFRPTVDNFVDLGQVTRRWQNVYTIALHVSTSINALDANEGLLLAGNVTTGSVNLLDVVNAAGVSLTGAGGSVQGGIYLSVDLNQTSTAAFTAHKMEIGTTAVGSGVQNLCSWNWGGIEMFRVDSAGNTLVKAELEVVGDLKHSGTKIGFYSATPAVQSAAYTRNATIVEDRTLIASASATTLNNNNVLAALIADLQAVGIIA